MGDGFAQRMSSAMRSDPAQLGSKKGPIEEKKLNQYKRGATVKRLGRD